MTTRKREKLLKKLYSEAGSSAKFANQNVLLKNANDKVRLDDKYTLSEVKAFLEKQPVWQLHKQPQWKIKRLPTRAIYLDQIWSADLVDMQKFSRSNDRFKWILPAVNVLSRKGFATSVTSKSPQHVLDGFKKIFASGRIPDNLHTGKRCRDLRYRMLPFVQIIQL